MKQTIKTIAVGFLSGVLGAYMLFRFLPGEALPQEARLIGNPAKTTEAFTPAHFPSRTDAASGNSAALNNDFVLASSRSASSVVYIKTVSQNQYGYSWFDWFFGDRRGQTISSGSGVIYSADGYIITNNHVIRNADQINVIVNKRSYAAKIVGTDPSTDIAVLKIEAEDLPEITLGSSRDVQVGEWVIAVGNPFNLTSTVTAGIVSAKGREINVLKSDFPIESFIQTDAAINPGNSGGALVNVKGELIGINTAILSQTGSYTGYGFAVPVDIVKKVADDLINYGEVQKAFLGAEVVELNSEIARRLDVSDLTGVVVSSVVEKWAADKAGLKRGDIILTIDGQPVNSRSEYEEEMSYRSPGDKIKIGFKRNNKIMEEELVLTNRLGSTHLIKREIYSSEELGADLEALPEEETSLLGIKNGIRLLRVKDGLIKRLGIQEGFIITHINKNPVHDPQQLENNLLNIRGRVIVEGVNKNGVRGYYTFYF